MHPSARKERGAYYTDPTVASFLVKWAIRSPTEKVLEPCFGGGVFLEAATGRIAALGGQPGTSITGIEVDPHSHASMENSLQFNSGFPALICGDFFSMDSASLGKFHAVVGNPPFIRYQRFSGSQRAQALHRASEAGVRLTALTSAWAPFVAHATSFLEGEGRLAMVAPAELCHAAYARPLLQLLGRRFRSVRVLTFARRLFPELSEDTVLVLAEGYGSNGCDIRLVALPDASALQDDEAGQIDGAVVHREALDRGVVRLITYLLPARTRDLYELLSGERRVNRLGTLASVGIGYVTGNNEFFHFTRSETRRLRIPSRFLAPALCSGSWLKGIEFTRRDWDTFRDDGRKVFLLNLGMTRGSLPTPVKDYLQSGQERGIHKAYKCRVRKPWYAVPHGSVPHLFLSYMANGRPALAVNRTRAVASNSLLCVRLRSLTLVSPEAVAVSSCTSLSALSAEIEGHSLGGGMLKLEPGEAVRLLLALPTSLRRPSTSRSLFRRLDALVRQGNVEKCLDVGDREILQRGLGMSSLDCARLREGFNLLQHRRRSR